MISYKYPIFPNKITQWMLAENLDACRWLYNRLLQDLNEAKEKDIKLKTYDTQNLIQSLKLENPKLNQVYSKVLQIVNYSDASFGDDVGSRGLQDAAVHTSINKREVDTYVARCNFA